MSTIPGITALRKSKSQFQRPEDDAHCSLHIHPRIPWAHLKFPFQMPYNHHPAVRNHPTTGNAARLLTNKLWSSVHIVQIHID